jgi:TPR repeat protein
MGTTKGRWSIGLLLALSACSPPPRSAADVDTGHFDIQLAQMYLNGDGVPRDDAKAFYLVSNASVAGDPDAKELLGRLYAEGRGAGRDDELATNLFRAAVDGGSIPALTDLGQMIETGRGTKPDPKSALDYYERGMDAGDPKARQNYQRLKKILDAPKPKAVPASTAPTVTKQILQPLD